MIEDKYHIEVDEKHTVYEFLSIGHYLDDRLNVRVTKSDNQAPFIRKYSFAAHQPLKKAHSRYLIPPYGHNLFGMIERDARLKDDIAARQSLRKG